MVAGGGLGTAGSLLACDMAAFTESVPDLRAVKCGWLTPKQALAINSDADTLARFVKGLPKARSMISHTSADHSLAHAFGRGAFALPNFHM